MLRTFLKILRRADRISLIILLVVPMGAVSLLLFSGSGNISESVCEKIRPLLFSIHESTQVIKTTSNLNEVQNSVEEVRLYIDELRDKLDDSSLADAKRSLKRQAINSYIRSYEYFLSYYYSTQLDERDLKYSNFGLFINVKDPSKIYEEINCVSDEEKAKNAEKASRNRKGDESEQDEKKSIYYREENFVETIEKNYEFVLWSSLIIFLTSAFLSFLIYRSSRSDPRYDTHVDTTINFDEQEFPISISNISKGGATIGPDYGFKQGDQISIKIEDNDLNAEIRWVWDVHAGIKFEKAISKSTVKRLTKLPPQEDKK